MKTERQEQKPQISTIGYTVGLMRTRLGISQTGLAEYVGTTPDHISRIARGKAIPSWELLFKLFAVANSEEAGALINSMKALPARDRRRDDMSRALRSATAVLRGLANYDQTPDEAKSIIKDFLEKWEDWSNNITWDGRFSTRL